jgi:hypothetical protein
MLKVEERKKYCRQRTRRKELKPSDFLESLRHQSALFKFQSGTLSLLKLCLLLRHSYAAYLDLLMIGQVSPNAPPSHFAQHFCANLLLSR